MTSPRVSVLMAVYNGERYLAQAVDSILSQTYTDFEFIIVDDCSTDGTASLLSRYQDSRVRVIRNHQNMRVSRSINQCLPMCRGEYIARMDADDISQPERFATQVTYLDENLDIGVVGCSVDCIDTQGVVIGDQQLALNSGTLMQWNILFNSTFVNSSTMLRRSLLNRVGEYDPSFDPAEDYELWYRLLQVTNGVNLSTCLHQLRLHSDSLSATKNSTQQHNAARVSQRAMSGLLGHPVPFEHVLAMHTATYSTTAEINAHARLLADLYHAFIRQHALTPAEMRWLHATCARSLYSLARRSPSPIQTARLFARAAVTSPALTLDWLNRQARQRLGIAPHPVSPSAA